MHPAYNTLSVEEAADLQLFQDLLTAAETALREPDPPVGIIAETLDHLISQSVWINRSAEYANEESGFVSEVPLGVEANLETTLARAMLRSGAGAGAFRQGARRILP